MKVLLVHPSGLMYTEVYLRLEPLGLERVAAACRKAGHEVRLLDLQVFRRRHFQRMLVDWRPDAIGFSLNYLANVPEVIDLARLARDLLPDALVFVGGHSASFTAHQILWHAQGAIDCVAKGEGEEIAPAILAARTGRQALGALPGVITDAGEGPPPRMIGSLDETLPARDLLRRRHKYFIGVLDPCASVEFSRGCPWNCAFCSAWTFYGRSYRKVSPAVVGEDLARLREPGVFIVDDVAFIHAEHGHAIADEVEKRRIRKKYYLETRCDVLLKNKEVFARWKKLGLSYMFLGVEAIDEEGLRRHRKRVSLGKSFEALDYARSLGIAVAVNIIADPGWDEARFDAVREWATSVPEIVHLTVNTPYPGTETWTTDARSLATRNYKLFDVQHAVLPTRLPLRKFYEELIETQQILARKHLGWRALWNCTSIAAGHLIHGQTNFVKALWKFGGQYNVEKLLADHREETRYPIALPERKAEKIDARTLYILRPELAGAALASERDRLGLANKGESAGQPP
ncbi:MAG TPA: hopanoid C-3 methylase HpnR [Reyranella sp.]|jgi:hopanoid C-3 methylase HpnR|nr:hopanoid C-3 methylase HpnR [Reyranella sp.]